MVCRDSRLPTSAAFEAEDPMALPARLTGTLPVSVAIHFVTLVLLLVVPLVADMPLPTPATSLPDYVRAMPVPAPPPPPRPATPMTSRVAPAVHADAAPTSAPAAILPEVPGVPPGVPVVEGAVPWGTEGGIGTVLAAPAPIELPPPPPKPAGPVRVAELPQPPRKIVDVRPQYPEVARVAHIGGTVVIEAIIDRTGHVGQLRVLRSVPLLDQAALDAVRQWRYTPSTLRGQPVEVLMTITVNFELR
jgi:protein TonB